MKVPNDKIIVDSERYYFLFLISKNIIVKNRTMFTLRLRAVLRPRLTIMQNKHVLNARDKGAPHKSDRKATYLISQIVNSTMHQTIKKQWMLT